MFVIKERSTETTIDHDGETYFGHNGVFDLPSEVADFWIEHGQGRWRVLTAREVRRLNVPPLPEPKRPLREPSAAPLRFIVPFTTIHPLVEAALREFIPEAERIDVSLNEYSYYELVHELWSAGGSFAVIEHDIEIHDTVKSSFEECPEPWCSFMYPGPGTAVISALGCVRFRSEALEMPPPRQLNWLRVDAEVQHVLRRRGLVEHIHEPRVKHHHVYGTRCACGEGPHGEI